MRSFQCASAALVLLVGASLGCAPSPEKLLVGKWKADGSVESTAFRAIKLKGGAPAASPGEAIAAAKILGSTTLELREDKTFEYSLATMKQTGTWSFDPQLSEVQLDLESKDFKGTSWVAYLDQSGPKLEFYMANREAVEKMKSSDSGQPTGRMVLKKKR
jgi:hypothetical protein